MWQRLDDTTRYHRVELCHYRMAQRWLVVSSQAACERAEASVTKAQQREYAAIEKPLFHLQAKRFESSNSHFDFGSIRVPGSYVSKRSSRAPNNALPRRLTLCTNSKNPKYNGKLSCEMPRCGRSHDLNRDQKPSIVLTCTS
jgi:hypothetical protein